MRQTSWVSVLTLHPPLAGEEYSRVQAHVDDDEFTAHILTDEAEYNIEVWEASVSYSSGRRFLRVRPRHGTARPRTKIHHRFVLKPNSVLTSHIGIV